VGYKDAGPYALRGLWLRWGWSRVNRRGLNDRTERTRGPVMWFGSFRVWAIRVYRCDARSPLRTQRSPSCALDCRWPSSECRQPPTPRLRDHMVAVAQGDGQTVPERQDMRTPLSQHDKRGDEDERPQWGLTHIHVSYSPTRITDRGRERTLAANPASKKSGASELRPRADGSVRRLVGSPW
jgi:hypothetical protein